jgi:hypothetical protein
MSLDVCNDRLFCNYNVSNNKPYYLIFNTISNIEDSTYREILEKPIDSEGYKQLVSLYTKPIGVTQNKYICIGKVSENIRLVLDSLEESNGETSDSNWKALDTFFGYNTQLEWKLDGYSKIKFLDIVISKSDTVQVLKYICGGYLDEPFSTEVDDLFIFSDKTIDSDQLC